MEVTPSVLEMGTRLSLLPSFSEAQERGAAPTTRTQSWLQAHAGRAPMRRLRHALSRSNLSMRRWWCPGPASNVHGNRGTSRGRVWFYTHRPFTNSYSPCKASGLCCPPGSPPSPLPGQPEAPPKGVPPTCPLAAQVTQGTAASGSPRGLVSIQAAKGSQVVTPQRTEDKGGASVWACKAE